MADEGIDWGDIGQAAAALFVAFAAQAGLNALLNNGKDKTPSSTLFADKQALPFATILVGGPSRVAGATMFDESDGNWDIILRAIHDGRIVPITQHYLNDDIVTKDGAGWVTAVSNGGVAVTDGRYVDQKVKFNVRLGLPIETADADIIARFPDLWDSTCRGDGTATVTTILIAPKAKFVPQAFPAREPQSITDIAQPGDIFDWRDEAQDRNDPTTWGPCENSVVNTVHILWYRWGLDWDRCIAPVLDDLTAEADIADSPRALKAGGTEPLYRVAGSYTDDMDRKDILQKLKDSMDGFVTTDGLGRLVVKCGHYEEPDFIVTADDIESGLRWSRGTYRDDRVSEIQITFANPASDFNMVACDSWVIDEDGGKSAPLALDWVTWLSQSRYLGRAAAARANPAFTGRIPLSGEKGREGLGKRWMRIQNPKRPSMDDVVCEVRGTEINLLTGLVIFDVITVSDPYSGWDAATMEGEAVGTTSRSNGDALIKPVINSVTPFYDGGNVRLKVVATGPDNDSPDYRVYWRVTGDVSWYMDEGDAVVISGGQIYVNSGVVTATTSLDVQVEYLSAGGVLSPRSDTYLVNSSVVPPSWADPGALWQAELTSASNRFWTGDTEYASLAAAISAGQATYSRASAAWVRNAAAAYTSIASGVVAMTDYGALIEPSATNSALYSDTMSNAAWVAGNGTKTAGQTTPFGTDGALYTGGGTSAVHYLRQAGMSIVSGNSYTITAWVKAGSADRVQLTLDQGFTTAQYSNFYLNGAGSVTATGTGSSNSIRLENGWYILTHTATASGASANGTAYLSPLATGSEARLTTFTSSATFTLGHLALGPTAEGSPITTTSSPVTRAATALLFKPVPGTYDITLTMGDGTTTTLSAVVITGSGWTVPTALGRYVTKIVATA